jgi:hypothetical protein
MRIFIKENNKIKLSLWLPSGPLVLSTFLRYFRFEGKRFPKEKRKLILQQIKQLRKFHKPLVLIDIEQKNGDKVLVKI